MRREYPNTRLDGKYMSLQIRIISLANREKRKKGLTEFDPTAIRDHIRSGNDYEES